MISSHPSTTSKHLLPQGLPRDCKVSGEKPVQKGLMNEIRRLNESNSDHYIDFLEKNGLGNISARAKMILPNDVNANNVAGDGKGIPPIHINQISLSALLNPVSGDE